MIKKTITYEDFNGGKQTEDVYFHLSKTELIDLEYSFEGGLTEILPELIKDKNIPKILELFKSIILKSYGKRSEDGRTFIKNEEEAQEFLKSPVFDALFMELLSSPETATAFIGGIIPKDLSRNIGPGNFDPELPWANREPTDEELQKMTHEQLLEVTKRRMQQT